MVIIIPEVKGDKSAIAKFSQHGLQMDTDLYHQILYNVFINACKFNKPSGSIKIRFSVYKPENHLKYKGQLYKSNQVVVETEIEDEGDGIEEEKKNSLFKIFENIKQNFIKDFTK